MQNWSALCQKENCNCCSLTEKLLCMKKLITRATPSRSLVLQYLKVSLSVTHAIPKCLASASFMPRPLHIFYVCSLLLFWFCRLFYVLSYNISMQVCTRDNCLHFDWRAFKARHIPKIVENVLIRICRSGSLFLLENILNIWIVLPGSFRR